jgi:hypothetical protein
MSAPHVSLVLSRWSVQESEQLDVVCLLEWCAAAYAVCKQERGPGTVPALQGNDLSWV